MKLFTESKKILTSPSHTLIKDIVKLRIDKDFRKKKNLVLIMGNKIVEEIAKKIPLELLIVSQDGFHPLASKKVLVVTAEIMKKITSLENPEELAALVPFPHLVFAEKPKRLLLIDGLADPGNLGTLIRTAAGLDWDGVILSPKTVDPFNDKALRAAKGATFSIPLMTLTHEEILTLIEEKKIKDVFLADMAGNPLGTFSYTCPLLLILSNEAHGVSSWAKNLFRKISIPISSKVESLNVAIAGGILMYHFKV